jgi:hypothetical protein
MLCPVRLFPRKILTTREALPCILILSSARAEAGQETGPLPLLSACSSTNSIERRLWCSRAHVGLIRHNLGGRTAFYAEGGVRALGLLLSNPATAVSMRRKALQLIGDLAAVRTLFHRPASGLVRPNLPHVRLSYLLSIWREKTCTEPAHQSVRWSVRCVFW